jgi:two-component system, NtrC family, sensor kinase
MKRLLPILLILQFFSPARSQMMPNADSVKQRLARAKSDTTRVLLYSDLGFVNAFLQVDTSIVYAQRAISLARQIQYKKGEAAGMSSYGWALWASGNYDKAIEAAFKSLNLYKELKNNEKLVSVYIELAVFYRDAGDFEEALKYGMLSKNLFESPAVSQKIVGIYPYNTIGSIYLFMNNLDSASFYASKAYDREKTENIYVSGYTLNTLGLIDEAKKHFPRALEYFHSVIPHAEKINNYLDIENSYTFISKVYQETGNIDSSIWYAKEIISKPEYSIFKQGVLDALTILAQNYRINKNSDSALKYLELRVALNDSLFNKAKARAIQNLTFSEQLRQQEVVAEKIRNQNRLKLYAVIALSTVFLLIGIILYRGNKLKQKANVLLQQQKQKVEDTLSALESAQSQLIQSEKMASLGELTAGIAHEIQNPLNFINNFSEINTELLEELDQEIETGNKDNLKSIAGDIRKNEEKINHHGKRADSIVKGMLQHSRKSAGQKEATDINALADEYLRLAYHGLRAKDKSFQVKLQTDFDPSAGNINIISQDIGRVLLNLYNNAFFAVTEKKQENPDGFEPTVSVSTKRKGEEVLISIKDNGPGIPQKIIDKIFQPFFTTKPTGMGTGLGLSMSYDIVKAHRGELKVNNREGDGAEFVVILPVN